MSAGSEMPPCVARVVLAAMAPMLGCCLEPQVMPDGYGLASFLMALSAAGELSAGCSLSYG